MPSSTHSDAGEPRTSVDTSHSATPSVDEATKPALDNRINGLNLCVHLIALALTIFVVQLSARNVFWFDADKTPSSDARIRIATTDLLKVLQYVAKVYEIILVASLTTICLHFARRLLMGPPGLPLGFAMIGYQIGSWNYLWSCRKIIHQRKLLWILLGLFIVVYTNLIGLSSAILIVPTLDWWPVANPFGSQPYAVILVNDFKSPNFGCPILLAGPDAEDIPDGCVSSDPALECPSGSWVPISSWVNDYVLTNASANVTVSDSDVQRLLIAEIVVDSQAPIDNSSGVAVATTAHHELMRMLGYFWEFTREETLGEITNISRPLLSLGGPSKVQQPLVQVQCAFIDFNDAMSGNGSSHEVTFPTSLLNNFSSQAYPTTADWVVDLSLYDLPEASNLTNFTWVDLAGGVSPPRNASIGTLVTVPYLPNAFFGAPQSLSNVSDLVNTSDPIQPVPQRSFILPCTIDARWINASLTHDPTTGTMVDSNITDPSIYARSNQKGSTQAERFDVGSAMSIDPAWAAMLNVPGQISQLADILLNTSTVQVLLDDFVQCNTTYGICSFTPAFFDTTDDVQAYGTQVAQTVSEILSVLVADGVSRTSHNSLSGFLMPNETDNVVLMFGEGSGPTYRDPNPQISTEQFMPFDVSIQRYGYGYGVKEGPTVILSMVVVLFHALLVLAYSVYRTIGWIRARFRPGKSSLSATIRACDNASEMLALALLSDSKQAREALGRVGAGIEEGATFNQTLRIRVGAEDDLQFVVGDNVNDNSAASDNGSAQEKGYRGLG